MSAQELAELASTIPDGPVWIRGETIKQIIAFIVKDRAVLAPGGGTETPTPNGRFFDVKASGIPALTPVYLAVNGQIYECQVPMIVGDPAT